MVLKDGRLLTGSDSPSDSATPRIQRYLANGRLDPQFDSGGLKLTRLWKIVDAGNDQIYARVTLADETESIQVIRLLPEGQLDTNFVLGITNEIYQIAGVPDGGLIVLTASSHPPAEETPPNDRSNQILRLRSDGTVDEAFHPVTNALMIKELEVCADNRIYLWGQLREVNGVPRFGLARLHMDGSLDKGFNPVHLNWSLSQWPNIEGVTLTSERKLLVFGQFSDANGVPRENLALLNWDGSLDSSFIPPKVPTDFWRGFPQNDGKVVLIGQFEQMGLARRKSIARLNRDGSVDESYLVALPAGDSARNGAMLTNGDTIVAGSTRSNLLARVRAGTPIAGPPRVIQQPIGQVRVRGQNVMFAATVRSHPPARYQWRFNGQDIPAATESAFSIDRLGYDHMGTYQLVVSNQFGEVITSPSHLLVNAEPVAPGSLDLTFDPLEGPNQFVKSVAAQGDKILILGDFDRYRGTAVRGLARLHSDGSLDVTFRRPDAVPSFFTVMALEASGRIYIGGHFCQYNGVARCGLVRLTADGEVDTSFAPEVPTGLAVWSLALLDRGRLVISGIVADSVPFAAILDNSGRRDPDFSIRGLDSTRMIRQLTAYPDGRFLGLAFVDNTDGSQEHTVFRFLANGRVDTTFQSGQAYVDFMGRLLLMSDGGALLGASFGSLKWGQDSKRSAWLLRLTPNGLVDEQFPTNWRGGHGGIGTFPNGDLAIGGSMIKRSSPAGRVDPRFQAMVSSVESMAWDSQGRMLIAGAFKQVNRSPRNYIARIHTTEQTPESVLWGPFVSAAGFELSLPTVTNRVYSLEYSGQLEASNWSSLLRIPGDGNWQTIRDPASETRSKFYRVRVEPPR